MITVPQPYENSTVQSVPVLPALMILQGVLPLYNCRRRMRMPKGAVQRTSAVHIAQKKHDYSTTLDE